MIIAADQPANPTGLQLLLKGIASKNISKANIPIPTFTL
jgi:hypothetical protein